MPDATTPKTLDEIHADMDKQWAEDAAKNAAIAKAKSDQILERKFQMGLWLIGGVGAVIWAAKTNRKGKFWWFLGGSIIGSATGFMIDGIVKKK